MVLKKLSDAVKKLVTPSGEEAVGIVGERPGLEALEAQKAYITTYAGVRGYKLLAIHPASTPEEAFKIIRENRGRVILLYSPEILGPGGLEKASKEAGGETKIILVRRELSGPKLGC